ncbi:MAG: helix-turn-helix domain-containing protein [Acidobacteriaceae bacterium]
MTKEREPEILAQVRTTDGVAFQLRRDFMGVLEVPELENMMVSLHVGTPTHVSCRRGGQRFTGTSVHGDIDVIPSRTAARWEMHDDNDRALLLSLPQALLHAVAVESGMDAARLEIRNRFQIRDRELETLGWAMKREMETGCPSGRIYMNGLTLALASRLVAWHSSAVKMPKALNKGLSGLRLKQVLAYIEEQLAEDLSLEQIAAVAGVSASHMKTLFRTAMGIPVHQYVIQRRVEHAKDLLAKDSLSMAEIAAATGFAHQSHMARHMRRVMGMPPLAMKRLLAETATS